MSKCDCNWKQKNVPGYGYDHWSDHDGRKLLIWGSILICFTVFAVWGYIAYGNYMLNLYADSIENFDCRQLQDEIAEHKKYVWYAEHRYKWLCIDNKEHSMTDVGVGLD